MRLSDGAVIPGNRRLDETERERRTRPYYAPYHRAIDCRHRPVPSQRRAASRAVDPLLHRELEGDAAALARRRALGPGPALRQAPARRPLRRGRPDRRRQRALLGPARGRLPVAARNLPRPRQCPHRDPPGPDPDCGGPGGLGAATLPHCPDDLKCYISGACTSRRRRDRSCRQGWSQRACKYEWRWGHDQDRQRTGDASSRPRLSAGW